jgi:hypothetical protein
MNRSTQVRLSKLEAATAAPDLRCALIIPRHGETPEQAEARHYAERPEDRDATQIIRICFVTPEHPV